MLYYYCITWTILCVCNYLNKFLACHLISCLIYFVFMIFISFFFFIVPWRWITGTPSLDCEVVEFEPEIEHKLCAIRRKRREEWEKKDRQEEKTIVLIYNEAMRDLDIMTTTSTSSIVLHDAARNYEWKNIHFNMVPFFMVWVLKIY